MPFRKMPFVVETLRLNSKCAIYYHAITCKLQTAAPPKWAKGFPKSQSVKVFDSPLTLFY